MNIYLSHPIRGLKGKDATVEDQHNNNCIAKRYANKLRVWGHSVYCPAEHDDFPRIAFEQGMLTVEQILLIDCKILEAADAVVVANWEGKLSGGMQVEADHAERIGIPVYTVRDQEQCFRMGQYLEREARRAAIDG